MSMSTLLTGAQVSTSNSHPNPDGSKFTKCLEVRFEVPHLSQPPYNSGFVGCHSLLRGRAHNSIVICVNTMPQESKLKRCLSTE